MLVFGNRSTTLVLFHISFFRGFGESKSVNKFCAKRGILLMSLPYTISL